MNPDKPFSITGFHSVARASLRLLPIGAQDVLRRLRAPSWRTDNLIDDEVLRAIIRMSVCDDGVLIDVGASTGDILRSAVEVAPTAPHIAIEPIDWLARRLADGFPTTTVYNLAAGDSEGIAHFYEYARSTRSSLSLLSTESLQRTVEVQVRRLDDVVQENLDIRIIKIDVEGHELEVLRGASRLIDRWRPIIAFEHGSPRGGYQENSAAIFELLESHRYNCFAARGPHLASTEEFERVVMSGHAWNFIAAATSSRSQPERT